MALRNNAVIQTGSVSEVSRFPRSRSLKLRSFDEQADRTGQASLYAGGVTAISRWLSAATPPVQDRTNPTTPAGSQRRRPPPFNYANAIRARSLFGHLSSHTPDGNAEG